VRPQTTAPASGVLPLADWRVVCGDGRRVMGGGLTSARTLRDGVPSAFDRPSRRCGCPHTRTQRRGLSSHEPSLLLGCVKMARVDKR
jgi:hypothetical protein